MQMMIPAMIHLKDNAIVRSFDDIGYECTYSGEINGNIQAVELEFKFTLNVSKKYAEFEWRCFKKLDDRYTSKKM